MREVTRRRLLADISNGDAVALARLYDSEAPLLAARLKVRGASPHQIEEVLQDTFTAVWERSETFRGDGSVAAWVWVIARNRWVSMTRSRAFHDVGAAGETEPENFADPSLHIDLESALRSMPQTMQEVVDAVAVRGLSTREAAEELGLPEGTVKSRLHRARARLKEELG